MDNSTIITVDSAAKRLQVKEIAILIAASVFLQFIIHLIPPAGGVPLGAVLLPMFYIPLIAVIFYKFHTALVVTAFGPILNYIMTGSPELGIVPLLTFEVLLFVLALTVLSKYGRFSSLGALISILAALMISPLVLGLFNSSGFSASFLLTSLKNAVPGIIIITVMNIFLLRLREKF